MNITVHYRFDWMFPTFLLEMKVRLSIFSIICASAGLPALVWSVGELIEHRKNGHRISFFIILLLLTDFAEIFLTPYILLKYLSNEMPSIDDFTFRVFWDLWHSLSMYGLLLKQLVALEVILSVRYPLYTAAVFSSSCYRIFYVFVFPCIIICKMIWLHFVNVFLFLASLITWIISCTASCSSERHFHTSRKPDQHLWVIFLLTLLILHLPLILFLCLLFFTYSSHDIIDYISYIILLLVSLRLISDPLVCVLVCRQNLRLQTSQNPEDNEVQTD